KISWRYFGIELLTGILFVMVGAQPGNIEGNLLTGAWVGDPVRLVEQLIVVSTLVVIFWIDYKTHLIQLEAVFLLGLAGVALDMWQVFKQGGQLTGGALFAGSPLLPAPLPQSLLAMVVTATILWILREGFSWYYGKEALGFGDVILVGAIAANLGWNPTILTFFFLSVVVGAIVGVGLKIPRATRTYLWAKARARRHGSRKSLAWPLARHTFRKTIPFGPMLAAGAIVAMLYGGRINEAYVNWLNPPLTNQSSIYPMGETPPAPPP
ncbi:MAG: prepilin peptidase, partial [Abitibacteriaceae bacterium]|nr:prepilin peptidase [Abditibacteriaceae bacterium]